MYSFHFHSPKYVLSQLRKRRGRARTEPTVANDRSVGYDSSKLLSSRRDFPWKQNGILAKKRAAPRLKASK